MCLCQDTGCSLTSLFFREAVRRILRVRISPARGVGLAGTCPKPPAPGKGS